MSTADYYTAYVVLLTVVAVFIALDMIVTFYASMPIKEASDSTYQPISLFD